MPQIIHSVIRVCYDCTIEYHYPGENMLGPDAHPWSLWDDEYEITPGMPYERHGCENPRETECDCDHDEFSWSTCQGCGSTLGGAREAFTVWEKES